ncbi:ANTAR domain-containing protein [Aeromicrobium sp.]
MGQAQGILMAATEIDAEATFASLQRLSQHHNLKPRDVAEHLLTTRTLPEAR